LVASRAAVKPNCVLIPSIRWTAFRFLMQVIWKHEAVPWRDAIVEYARKYSQICIQLANVTSKFPVKTYAVPTLAVLGLDLVLVAEPVAVPPPKRS
jgi:hypothetical protein